MPTKGQPMIIGGPEGWGRLSVIIALGLCAIMLLF